MIDRRTFLGALAAPMAGTPALPHLTTASVAIGRELSEHAGDPEATARDEGFWKLVRQSFHQHPDIIYFNNGGVSPAPVQVIEAVRKREDEAYTAPAYWMWRVQEKRKEAVRERLAATFGCAPEELAITRNATEGLQTCQFGIDLEPGDEVLTTTQDYPRMLSTFRQRERREKIVLRKVKIPTPCEDPALVVRAYEEAITDRTKLLLVCHMINLTGQILPVRDVVAMARKRGIPTIVDGAHAFAHFKFRQEDLDCDYYASSLHKWLFGPLGTGMLYVRKSKIQGLWPLLAAEESLDDDIKKFEQIGTHNVPVILGIASALDFHESIGIERKEARLVYLRDRWARRLLENDRVHLNTSLRPGESCGIANVQLDGIDTAKLCRHLWQAHKIYTIRIEHEEFEGLRVSPSVYTSLEEVDLFIEVLEDALQNGLPA
ncbi:MAG: aminotransferase class V-fold PLP-dependent enzyme [bacterium]|nr:aminotransferase class V-fold PLP-dependent enzyme [bacterium]